MRQLDEIAIELSIRELNQAALASHNISKCMKDVLNKKESGDAEVFFYYVGFLCGVSAAVKGKKDIYDMDKSKKQELVSTALHAIYTIVDNDAFGSLNIQDDNVAKSLTLLGTMACFSPEEVGGDKIDERGIEDTNENVIAVNFGGKK